MRSERPDLGLYVLAIDHHMGAYEREIRLKLDTWGFQKPPAEWGIVGSEFRVGPVEHARRAVEAVYDAHAKEEGTGIPGERERKRRRLNLEIGREELELRDQELETRNQELETRREELRLLQSEMELLDLRRQDLQLRREALLVRAEEAQSSRGRCH